MAGLTPAHLLIILIIALVVIGETGGTLASPGGWLIAVGRLAGFTGTYLMLVMIVPAIAAMLPGMELNASLAVVPLVNVSLVCKEMISGTWHWNYILLIFGSACLYAAAALAVAVWMFHREEVLFRS